MNSNAPNRTATPIYRAVGVALTVWESVESAMSELYSAFVSGGYDFQAIATYGKSNRTFENRLLAVENAALKFFVVHHSQSDEGEFKLLAALLREQAKQRNLIAHGHVSPRIEGGYKFSVPWYAVDRFSIGFDELNSSHLLGYAKAFRTLAGRLYKFSRRVHKLQGKP